MWNVLEVVNIEIPTMHDFCFQRFPGDLSAPLEVYGSCHLLLEVFEGGVSSCNPTCYVGAAPSLPHWRIWHFGACISNEPEDIVLLDQSL